MRMTTMTGARRKRKLRKRAGKLWERPPGRDSRIGAWRPLPQVEREADADAVPDQKFPIGDLAAVGEEVTDPGDVAADFEADAHVRVEGVVAVEVGDALAVFLEAALPHARAVKVVEGVGDARRIAAFEGEHLGHLVVEVIAVGVVVVEGLAREMALAGAVAVAVVGAGEGGVAVDGPGAGLVAGV
jgi:hypothetical protein